jgi:RecA/RadA recombinase
VTVVVIAAAAAVVIFVVAAMLRRAHLERDIERRRVVGEWDAHQRAAESNVARARSLGAEAQHHRDKAAEHAALADEHAEAAIAHAQQADQFERMVSSVADRAGHHEAEAAEREAKLG